MNILNNKIDLMGTLSTDITFSHEYKGEQFYKAEIQTKRKSGTIDKANLIIPKNVLAGCELPCGNGWRVSVVGQVRTRTSFYGKKRKLVLYVFADFISVIDEDVECDRNDLVIVGVLKSPINHRQTPNNRTITDFFIGSKRVSSQIEDYIPCICWGRAAVLLACYDEGTKISINGRLQSREYTKVYDDGRSEVLTTYEVSCARFEVTE